MRSQVLSINGMYVQNFRHFAELLESCGQNIEIQFYHKAGRCIE